MQYELGDIIRFKYEVKDRDGLYEIVSPFESNRYWVTNDECNSESLANHDDLILVCKARDRKDISL